MLGERIPLRRVKTMRKTLSGKNMLKNLLKKHPYRLSQISFRGSNLTIHPLRNIRDVFGRMALHSAPWCSSLAWSSSGGSRWDVGVGVPAGGRDTGKQEPHPEEKAFSSPTVGLCDWAWQLPGGR